MIASYILAVCLGNAGVGDDVISATEPPSGQTPHCAQKGREQRAPGPSTAAETGALRYRSGAGRQRLTCTSAQTRPRTGLACAADFDCLTRSLPRLKNASDALTSSFLVMAAMADFS